MAQKLNTVDEVVDALRLGCGPAHGPAVREAFCPARRAMRFVH